jgi:hypothetical protein
MFIALEEPMMAAAPRSMEGSKPRGQDATAKKPGGRPKGDPSIIVNVRLPVALLVRLDRYLDRLEVQTGLKANRGMIARRALELFLEAHESGDTR